MCACMHCSVCKSWYSCDSPAKDECVDVMGTCRGCGVETSGGIQHWLEVRHCWHTGQHSALDYHDAGTMHAVIASGMVNRMPIPGLMECIASDHAVSLQQTVGTCKQALADMPQEEFVDNRLTPEFRNFSVNQDGTP